MWIYEKKLQFPVKIKNPDPRMASVIVSQLGGPDGELAASMRYLNQRFSMPDRKIAGILTDVGTEELAHLEMIGSILYQLTRNLSAEEIEKSPMAQYFTDHTTGVYPASAAGVPTDMKYIGVKGDVLADLNEDLAADAAIPKVQVLSKNQLNLLKIDKDKLFSQIVLKGGGQNLSAASAISSLFLLKRRRVSFARRKRIRSRIRQ